jgi:hypothetical protein
MSLIDDFLDSQDVITVVHTKASEFFKQHGYKTPSDGTDSVFQYAYDCKGEGLFDYFARAPEMGRRFASMMTAWSVGRPRWMHEGYYPVQERLVEGSKQGEDAVFLVDVGGGRGHDLEGLKGGAPQHQGQADLAGQAGGDQPRRAFSRAREDGTRLQHATADQR